MRPWYPFYPSDYQSDTKFLSPMADLVYRRMLDLYWMNQGPIPLNYPAIARAIGVDTRVVKRYLQGELKGMWVTSDASLHNIRMDAEIAKSDDIHEVRAKAGKSGGLAKAKANAKAKALAPQSQSHIKEKDVPKVTSKKKVIKKKSLPKKFSPPTLQEVIDYSVSRDSKADPKQFYDYYTAGDWVDGRGNAVKNWKQKFITWEKNNSGGNNNGGHSQVSRRPTAVERVERATGLDKSSSIIDITPHGSVVGKDDEIIW